jgi:hypothetical protein
MNAWVRYMNVILGVWLVLSAFMWPHTMSHQTNAWVVGILAIAFAVIATRRDEARYLNTALSVWLFASIWFLPSIDIATLYNAGIVAVAMFIFSLIPNTRSMTEGPMRRTGHPGHVTTGASRA